MQAKWCQKQGENKPNTSNCLDQVITFYSKIIKNNLYSRSVKTANTHMTIDNILVSKDIKGPDQGQGEFR
jgi:hypothetical protein